MPQKYTQSVLLTGATGYVGGRLLKRLEKMDVRLRCMARVPSYLQSKTKPETEVIEGDVLNSSSLKEAFKNIDVAYYLIHSMGQNKGFRETDRMAARNFARSASEAGVKRIIYLGGLGDSNAELSEHLRSRHEVGKILKESGIPTIELRASIVLGSGSLSFELIRSLTEKLPVMVMPRWVQVPTQPIGIEDLLDYLIAALNIDIRKSEIFEIGGSDQLTYQELMKEYARQRNLNRLMIPVPILTPKLSSLWLGLVTPLYARVGRKLIDSIFNPTIVRDNRAQKVFGIQPKSSAHSIAAALKNEDRKFAETFWSDALSATTSTDQKYGGSRLGNRIVDYRKVTVAVDQQTAFEPIARIGGENGWYAYNFLWQLRGALDLLLGGVGMRRNRRPGRKLQAGDTIDFWRVEKIEAPKYLNLHAEMKLPGQAWLEFEVSFEDNLSTIHQSAVFHPRGLFGLVYWYGVYPVHSQIFRAMLKSIAKQALKLPRT